jgi:trehalose 6-phosphate synthase/phosphatase
MEQVNRNRQIQRRLRRYTVEKWASEFIRVLKDIKAMQHKYASKLINKDAIQQIQRNFQNSEKRILFLDYNGTLVYSEKSGEYLTPDAELYQLLDGFARDDTVDIVLMSSRDKDILEQWFGKHEFMLFAEHGMWKKTRDNRWRQTRSQLTIDWKNDIRPVIESYVDRTPGSYLEEMNNVLSWHFEKSDPDHGRIRAYELKDELAVRILNMDLQILEGKDVIEIKPAGMNKGIAALQTIRASKYDFVMAIGDDWTDEYLFELLPDTAITIRVGIKKTHAIYNCESYKEVRKLLKQLGSVSKNTKTFSISPNV